MQIRDVPYTPAMFSDPFAYRAGLTDADLDFYDERVRLSHSSSVLAGLITQKEADQRMEERQKSRENMKAGDRFLEMQVDDEWDTSDDSFDDEEKPLTPPRSPDRQPVGLDLSIKAWNKECALINLRRRFDLKDFGFEDYETWKQYQIKHTQPPPSIAPPIAPSNPPILQTRSRRNTRASEKDLERTTRSRTQNIASLTFYELGEDGKTRREISKRPRGRQARPHALGTSHRPNGIRKRPRKKIP